MMLGGGLIITSVSAGENSTAYPFKPLRVVASSAGGSADSVARLLGLKIAANLGQPLVIDNRGGSGGIVAAEIVAKAPPDGYSLLIYGSTLWIGPLMRDKSTYDVARDFAPVTMTGSSISVLVVSPALSVKTVPQLIALAKAKPGTLNYGAAGTGSTGHLAAELFKAMAGVNIVRINYKGNAPVLTDMIAGQIQLTFGIGPAVEPHVRSGRLTALAITSAQPSPLLPGVPTIASTGLPGYEAVSYQGLFAPAKTPVAIIEMLNHEIVRALKLQDVKERMLSMGVEPVGSTPQQLAATIASEISRMGKVIKDAGIREQ